MTSDSEPPAERREPSMRGLFHNDAHAAIRSRIASTEPPAAPGQPAPPRPAPAPSGYVETKGRLQERFFDEAPDLSLASDEEVAEAVRTFVADVLATEPVTLNESERERLADELTDEVIGLGPLAILMADPAVTDILVNGPESVYVERFGRLERTDVRFHDAEHVSRVIDRIATRVGRRVDQASPMADLRLPDGSRVNATIPPASIDYPTISIRRFGRNRLRRGQLVRLGTLSSEMADFLGFLVRMKKNLLISGGTGAGKSTLLGALAESIPSEERVITVEDVAELILDQEHVVRLETRPPNVEGRGEIRARELVVNALRMRPNRIIVGEVRGAEALDMLQAMNTGHEGSLSTIHANSPRDALHRLETMVLMSGVDLPSHAIREQIVSALHYLVHVTRFEDGTRRVERIAEIEGMEGETPLLQDVFAFVREGRDGERVVGRFEATRVVPRVVDEARARGIDVPLRFLREQRGPKP